MEIIIIDKRIAPNKEYHPYDVAYKKQFTVHERGTFANEITKRIFLEDSYPRWYDEGKNHIVDGMKFEYLKEQSGDVRFQNYRYGNNVPAIYIYDWI